MQAQTGEPGRFNTGTGLALFGYAAMLQTQTGMPGRFDSHECIRQDNATIPHVANPDGRARSFRLRNHFRVDSARSVAIPDGSARSFRRCVVGRKKRLSVSCKPRRESQVVSTVLEGATQGTRCYVANPDGRARSFRHWVHSDVDHGACWLQTQAGMPGRFDESQRLGRS